jgi:D-tyrosyl-tRNA(Tyr) deacylase
MRAVLQRVSRGKVIVDGQTVASIGGGLVILLGITHGDDALIAQALAKKAVQLRIFTDDDGKLNRSVLDVGGEVIVVSQFTLYADSRKGLRPSFTDAALPDVAAPLVDAFASTIREMGVRVDQGVFGAHMEVDLVNDGPVTIILDV